MTITRKKLIEVALPLEAINAASAREKSIRHGHPSTLHLWWARRPLAAARAVIFAQMVDDPSACPEEFATEEKQEAERQRLFMLIEQLVLWENTTNETVLQQAREEIWRSWRRTCADNKHDPRAAEFYNPGKLPAFHDPFAGGGALPLEAQRLGLEAYASDLNPVAALINKAMIEIPPKFAGRPPVNPEDRSKFGASGKWKGAAGLAADVRFYGNWMREEAERRIGHLYPKVLVTAEMLADRPDLKPYEGRSLTVIAWLWARTVRSPDPAFRDIDVPLATTLLVGTKPGKEVFVEPVVQGRSYSFKVRTGRPSDMAWAKRGTKEGGSGSTFRCLMSGAPMPFQFLRDEAKAGRMGARLMAVVAEGDRGRVYLSPTPDLESIAQQASPAPDLADTELPERALGFRIQEYGMTRWRDLFTSRQLVGLTTLADLVRETRDRVRADAGSYLGREADDYSDALAVYLGLCVGRVSDYSSTICTWANNPQMEIVRGTFARQALPMTWDFAEANPFGPSTGSFEIVIGWVAKVLELVPAMPSAQAFAHDAATATNRCSSVITSTDPPYYDNIGYADLSDYFYFWLRRALRDVFPDLFATLAVPKVEELIASPFRHDSRERAEKFFLDGMTKAIQQISSNTNPALPMSLYYAFKQAEGEGFEGSASTGWETFLGALMQAGLEITGTWPVRTERKGRSIGIGTNALASSIVLVCRRRSPTATIATRTDFLQELSRAMRDALPTIVLGEIAPVDLAQASIGPGMAVYSQYSQVLRQDGKPVTVREALHDINNAISAYRTERTSSFDPKTRFCIDFYDQFGFDPAEFDQATVLARAQAVGVDTLENEHLLVAERGKAWLVALAGYPIGIPGADRRFAGSAWEACMRLAATLQDEGESATAALARELGEGVCARARELAVWLYTIADVRKRSQDALAFNALDASWPEIQRLMASMDRGGQQGRFA